MSARAARRRTLRAGVVALALLLGGLTAFAPPAAAATCRPYVTCEFKLPDGFAPEGIAIDSAGTAYFGSRLNGDLYKMDVSTGEGHLLARGPGTPSLGMKADTHGRLWVAGGTGGDARVIDTASGRTLFDLRLATAPKSFVNDVVLTPGGAYFTDSANPVLYRVTMPATGTPAVTRIPLTGAIKYAEGTNANGIVRTADGSALLIVQSNKGLLFRVEPATGVTTAVTVRGLEAPLTNGDGLLNINIPYRVPLHGLLIVRNRANEIVTLMIDADGRHATYSGTQTDTHFDTPSTIAEYNGRRYLPNARFGETPAAATPYTAVALPVLYY